jgi:hypothetical protein
MWVGNLINDAFLTTFLRPTIDRQNYKIKHLNTYLIYRF